MIEFLCICGAAFSVADNKAGCKAKCRLCGADLIIPQPLAPTPPPEPLLLTRPTRSFSPDNPAAPATVRQSLKDCLTYPFRGEGWALILGGAIATWIMAFIGGMVPYIGFMFPQAVQLYVLAYLMHVIDDSGKGEPLPPDWPDWGRLGSELFGPVLRALGAIAWALLPLFLANALLSRPWESSDPLATLSIFNTSLRPEHSLGFVIRTLALASGLATLPMNLVAVSVRERLSSLSPTVILPAIIRCGRSYWISVGCLTCIFLVGGFVLVEMRRIPILGYLTATPLFICFGMVQARLLGLIYHRNAHKLKWFD